VNRAGLFWGRGLRPRERIYFFRCTGFHCAPLHLSRLRVNVPLATENSSPAQSFSSASQNRANFSFTPRQTPSYNACTGAADQFLRRQRTDLVVVRPILEARSKGRIIAAGNFRLSRLTTASLTRALSLTSLDRLRADKLPAEVLDQVFLRRYRQKARVQIPMSRS